MSIGVELALDNRAVEMLRKSYSRYLANYSELNEIQLKMATIPIGSTYQEYLKNFKQYF
jgi:hypothetical protein